MELEKLSPPRQELDRSTKKARFKAQGEDINNTETLSFRDKLIASQKTPEDELVCRGR